LLRGKPSAKSGFAKIQNCRLAKIFFSSGSGRLFFFVHFRSGFQFIGFPNLGLSLQFSFLPLVKVLVNCGLCLFSVSFGQVTFAKILFFGCVRGCFCRFSKLTWFLWQRFWF
jgi:hypothetical protein